MNAAGMARSVTRPLRAVLTMLTPFFPLDALGESVTFNHFKKRANMSLGTVLRCEKPSAPIHL
jgi:hypothetical protein